MNNLVSVVGLQPIIERHNIEWSGENFEELFSRLASTPENAECVDELERAVFDYFASLKIPDEPTLYDHLVLSLRKKDVIVTFNWDPLLWQALCRNGRFTDMPLSLYLHGNVAVGYCGEHTPMTLGARERPCGRCSRPLKESRLLYPITQKNYNADQFIETAWREVQRYLEHALMFTIFGYSAPRTDVEAIRLLEEGWGDADQRDLEQVEIVDIKNRVELARTWAPFICRDHYFTYRSFYDSMIALHPRRSCEAMWDAMMDLSPHDERPLPRDAAWAELLEWYRPLVEQESEQDDARTANDRN